MLRHKNGATQVPEGGQPQVPEGGQPCLTAGERVPQGERNPRKGDRLSGVPEGGEHLGNEELRIKN